MFTRATLISKKTAVVILRLYFSCSMLQTRSITMYTKFLPGLEAVIDSCKKRLCSRYQESPWSTIRAQKRFLCKTKMLRGETRRYQVMAFQASTLAPHVALPGRRNWTTFSEVTTLVQRSFLPFLLRSLRAIYLTPSGIGADVLSDSRRDFSSS